MFRFFGGLRVVFSSEKVSLESEGEKIDSFMHEIERNASNFSRLVTPKAEVADENRRKYLLNRTVCV